MKEEHISKLKSMLKDGGSATIYYNNNDGLRWMKISVDDKSIDIYPYYSAKISVAKSRPKLTITDIGEKDYIEIENAGKQKFIYSFSCIHNTEKVTFSKYPLKEDEEID